MTMTLKQAFTIWASYTENLTLAAKSRMPVQQVLMKKYGDVALEQITKGFAERLFKESPADHETKVRAASILVYVLQWGAKNDHCQMPAFDISIVGTEQRESTEDFMRKRQAMVSAAAKEALLKDDPKKKAEKPAEAKPEKKKRKGHKGAKMKKVCKLDPGTLEVIETYDSLTEACKANGIIKLTHALSHHQRAGGYYWCTPEDVKDFRTSKGYAGSKNTAQVPEPKKPAVQMTAEPIKTKFWPEPMKSDASHKALEVFTDDELIAELKARQWHGEITKTLTVKL